MSNNDVKQSGNIKSSLWQNSWLYAVALAAIVIAVFSGFIFSDKMLYSSDQLSGIDARTFYNNSIGEHRQFPFWLNPRLSGMPTIDALFGDALYPPTIVINSALPIHRAIGCKMILHVFLAGLFFFLMLRRGFSMSAPLAFAGGVLYMLNPEFLSHVYPGHDGKMFVIAWLPFIVWQLKKLADVPNFLNMTLLGLGIGMALLTSHVQMTYFVLWGLFAYAVFAVVRRAMQRETAVAVRTGVYFTLAVAVGLAIGFILLYPSMMFVREAFSVRGIDRGFEHAASWSLHWPEFFSLWVPEFGNTLDYYWGGNPFKLNSEYAGGIVLVLAVLAVVWKSRPWRWFWIGVVAFAALYSMGAHTPVFHIAYAIVPGVKKFRACSMIMFWFSFGTILLAMLFLRDLLCSGMQSLPDEAKKKRVKNLFVAIAVLFGVTLVFSMQDVVAGILPFIGMLDTGKRQAFDANFQRNFVPMLWLWFAFAASALGLVMAVIRKAVKPGLAAGIILAVCAIDVLRVDVQFIQLIDPRPYFYREPALDKLRSEMAITPFRVFTLPGTLSQNGEGTQGLESVSGFHDNELRWYREFRGDQQDRNYYDQLLGFTASGEAYLKAENIDKGNPFLDIANAKYLLARNGGSLLTIENRNALGRVSFAPNFVVVDSGAVIPALRSGGYDYRTTVALFKQPSVRPAAPVPDSLARRLPAMMRADWRKYSPNTRIVKVSVPTDGFLRISEVYYPGWKVTIDGKPAEINRADLAWMAVFIPHGDHEVVITAHSLWFRTSAAVSVSVLVLLCCYWAARGVVVRRRIRGVL
ncbi:MAG: YfhO family protein [Chitinispirillaceae bacterium]|nr:YfhO family protein [Chitinispirillaceae bacterium]